MAGACVSLRGSDSGGAGERTPSPFSLFEYGRQRQWFFRRKPLSKAALFGVQWLVGCGGPDGLPLGTELSGGANKQQ